MCRLNRVQCDHCSGTAPEDDVQDLFRLLQPEEQGGAQPEVAVGPESRVRHVTVCSSPAGPLAIHEDYEAVLGGSHRCRRSVALHDAALVRRAGEAGDMTVVTVTGAALRPMWRWRRRSAVVCAVALVVVTAASAWPSLAAAACSVEPACLEATFPSDYAWGQLNLGGNESVEQVITVTSNQSWGVRIASDLADGRMKEWSGSAYVATAPKILEVPLEWAPSSIDGVAQSMGYRAVSSTSADAVSGQPSTCPVDCSPVQIGVRYRQVLGFADAPAGVNEYRIVLSFEAAQGL